MAYPTIMFGPESEVYNEYAAVSPAPGNNGSGGPIAQRGVLPLGQQLILQDGRKFRFCLAGGTALVVGNVLTSAAIITTDQSMACAATAANSRTITFTHGAATVVINYFAEGYGLITVTPSGGEIYKIASHAALTSGGSDTVNLAPGHAVRTALTTTSDLSLMAHPYAGVIQAAVTTLTGAPVGVAVKAITANYFGWVQTAGPACVLTIGTLVVGANAVSPTGTAAGACGPSGASTSVNIGRVQMLEATTEWSGIDLAIDS